MTFRSNFLAGFFFFCASCVAVSNVSPASANDFDKEAAQSLVKAYTGACLQALPDLEKIEAGARVAMWPEIKGDAAKLLAPQNKDSESKSWLVKDVAMTPFILGISRANAGGKVIISCALTNPYAPVMPIRQALEAFLQLGKPVAEDTSAGQKMTIWILKLNGKDVTVALLDASPMNENGITLSAMVGN